MEWRESTYSQETAFRLARAGAWVRIVPAEDACEVCKAMASRAYAPSEVPRLPVRGCLREHCRCHFVAVDPETKFTVPQLARRGIQALKDGDAELARDILRKAVALDETYEPGWLWLSGVAETHEKIACLEKVLALNPRHRRARAGLELLKNKQKAPEPSLAPGLAQSAPPEAETRAPSQHVPEKLPSAPVEDARPPVHPQTERVTKPLRSEAPVEFEEKEDTLTSLETARAPDLTEEERPTEAPSLPPEVMEEREERKVIVEQWIDFMSISMETDSQMLMMQGQAFLRKLAVINERTLDMLLPETHLEELQLQWRDSESMGEALADAFDLHRSRHNDSPEWRAMHRAVGHLAQQLVEHRNDLRAQIVAAGGEIPER